MTIIRDINGNRLNKTLRHFTNHASQTDKFHRDSTGLWVIDYTDHNGAQFCAMIRPASRTESNAVALARRIGKERV